jgi:hypothetical protein
MGAPEDAKQFALKKVKIKIKIKPTATQQVGIQNPVRKNEESGLALPVVVLLCEWHIFL